MLRKLVTFLQQHHSDIVLPFQKQQPLMTNIAKKCPHCKKRGLILHEQNFIHAFYECKFCGEILQTYSIWLGIAIAGSILLILFILIMIVIF
jgi:uncharacterized protein (DUF983 family)